VISIAADIVPITGENRTLAKIGLKKLRNTKKLGLKKLLNEKELKEINISNIVFGFAPKINAAGRISHGKAAVELMISDDKKNAEKIVNQILEFNSQRKEMDNQMTQSAMEQVEQQLQNSALIAYSPEWSKGVIGIVASRLVDAYYKPTLIFTDGQNGEMVASARSVSDFDIHRAIEQCSDLLLKFGGHRAAAGLTMRKENFRAFKTRFEKIVSENIQEYQKYPSIEIDTRIKSSDLNTSFFNFHRKLAPFGPENMKPILAIEAVSVSNNVVQIGKDKTHVKFYIVGGDGVIECVGFGLGKYYQDFKTKSFDMVFSIEENHWKGNVTYYLNIKDVKFNE